MCKDCEAAERNPGHPVFNWDCLECRARAMAQGPAFFYSRQAGRLTAAYERAMRTCFGDAWDVWHPRVKEWAEQIEREKNDCRN